MKTFKTGFLQFAPRYKNVDENLQIIQNYKDKITELDIIVLPELATTGYVFHTKAEILPYADKIPAGKQSEFFFDLAKKTDTLIITGMAEKDGDRVYNAQVAFYPDGKYEKYRKIHLFHEEKNTFDTAYNVPVVIDYMNIKIGLMVCFDWAFPEHARVLMLKGAHILAHSSNLVLPGMGQRGMQTRSMENRVFSITANRYGTEETLKFTGESQIVDIKGKVLKKAHKNEEVLIYAEINPQKAEDKNITPLNNIIKDRRIGLYKGLLDDL